ncbi:MAG: hypothetical protein AAFV53_19430 [Myxococcota bacterium]
MNGLLLLLSLNLNDAEARGHHRGHYIDPNPNPIAVDLQHHEHFQLVSLVQQWNDASRRGSRRAEFYADNALRDWVRFEMQENRAKIDSVSLNIDRLQADIRNVRQRMRYDGHPKLHRRLNRLENRLQQARWDLNAIQNHQNQTRAIVRQLRNMQPRFEQGFANRYDYRTKSNLLWQLVDVSSREPIVNSTLAYSSTTTQAQFGNEYYVETDRRVRGR